MPTIRHAPSGRDGRDRLVRQAGSGEIPTAGVQALGSNPIANGELCVGKRAMKEGDRRAAGARDLLGIEVRIAQIGLDVDLGAKQELGGRASATIRRYLQIRIESPDQVDRQLGEHGVVRADAAVRETIGQLAKDADGQPGPPSMAGDAQRRAGSDRVGLLSESGLGQLEDERIEWLRRVEQRGLRGVVARYVPRAQQRRPIPLGTPQSA